MNFFIHIFQLNFKLLFIVLLKIISWNGVSCINEGFVFKMGGFIFKCWGGGAYGGHQFWWEGGFEKNCKMGDAPHAPTMEKPEKNHLIIIALY